MTRLLIAAAALVIALPLALMLLAAGQFRSATAGADAPTSLAAASIPSRYLALYMAAAQTCPGLPWQILAAIGEVETSHGQSKAPGVHSGANFAGAEGPMQFEPATFAEYGVNADPSMPPTPYDPADAIYSAARMLCASGARGGTAAGIRRAIFAYNHADWYVDEVLSWAARYAGPQQVNSVVQAAIRFAEQQLGKPYQWGSAGPGSYDCSGLVYAAYASAGIAIGRTTFQWQDDGPPVALDDIEPGDLLFSAGSDGSAANPGHVVMYLGGGQVIQAMQTGTPVQIDPVDLNGVIVATRPAALAGTAPASTQGGNQP